MDNLANPAHLTVPCDTANALIQVLEDTKREYDVDHAFIHRDGNGAAVAVVMSRDTFEALRKAAS